jgi:hypothetical protein
MEASATDNHRFIQLSTSHHTANNIPLARLRFWVALPAQTFDQLSVHRPEIPKCEGAIYCS